MNRLFLSRKLLVILISIVGSPSVGLAQKQSATEIMCAAMEQLRKIGLKKSFNSCESQKVKVPPVVKIEPVYETCTNQNNYIEQSSTLTPLAPVVSTLSDHGEQKLSPLCVLEAQKVVMKDNLSFARCRKNSLKPQENYPRPCVSEKYHKYVERAFQAVVQCFGVPAQQMAGILTIESGFHINAQAMGQGSGICQIVEGTIGGINKVHYKNFQKIVRQSPACTQLVPFMKRPITPDRLARCVTLWPPENPVTNLIYGAILYKTNAEIIDKQITRIESRLREVMSNEEFEALVNSLKLLSHNDAPRKIMDTLDRFIKKKGAALKASDFRIEAMESSTTEQLPLPGTFLNFLRENHSVPGSGEAAPSPEVISKILSRRSIVANYLPKMFGYMKKIEASNGGLSCLTPGLKKLYQ